MRLRHLLACLVACLLGGACQGPTDAPVRPGRVLADEVPRDADGFGGWPAPANLRPVVNSRSTDRTPELSPDGLSLYFASNRPGGFGFTDIYVARRAGLEQPWSQPANLGAVINSSAIDGAPHLSRDGHHLYFSAGSAGGSQDIWVATRPAFGAPWALPVNLGPPVNTEYNEAQPSLSADGRTLLFASDRPGGSGGEDLYMTTRETRPQGEGPR